MTSLIKITREDILSALSTVQEPELHRDLVTLNMIRDLKVDGGKVAFTIMLTTPACPLRTRIEKEARDAVMKINGVQLVEINMDSNVPSDGRNRGLLSLPVRNAIAIASGKGGVGKSTVAVNVAVALAQSGAKVGLLDADIYGPNVPTMMGVDHLPPMQDGKLVPAETYGVKMMSIGFLVKPGQPLIWRGPMLHSAIRQFLEDVKWGELDYLVIDLPPGTGDAQLSLAMFRELNVPILGVVENMSYLEMPDGSRNEIFGNGGGEALARMGNVSLLGSIPIDPVVRKGGDEGQPVVIAAPDSPAGKALREVTETIAAKVSVAAYQSGSGVTINMVG